MKIENLKQAQRFFQQKKAQYAGPTKKNSVIVGYTAAYALHVHENLYATHGEEYNAKHAAEIAAGLTKSGRQKRGWKGKKARGKGQQAKFLEKPARELSNSGEIGRIVRQEVANGGTLENGLLLAGQRIQRESQKIVPIDTGNLRASAFTRKESSNNVSSTRRS